MSKSRKPHAGDLVLLVSYWSLETTALKGAHERFEDDYPGLCERVKSRLKEVAVLLSQAWLQANS